MSPKVNLNTPFKGSNPWLIAGLVLFFINRYLDRNYGFPVLDLALPILVAIFALSEKRLIKIAQLGSFWVFVVLTIYICFSFAINEVQVESWPRRLVVVITTFLPVVMFRVVQNKRPLISFTVGCILGFSLYFVSAVLIDLSHGGVSRELRGIQPTPVVALAFYVLLKDEMSKVVRVALILAAVMSAVISLAIVARGPIVAVAIALGLWAFSGPRIMRAVALPTAACLGFAAHFVWGLEGSVYASLIGTSHYTVSNAERAYAIDYCVGLVRGFPWFGQSPDNFALGFAHSYDSLAGILRKTEGVLSPHNTFLEYASFYGLPAAALMLIFIWITLSNGGRKLDGKPLAFALIIAGVVRLGAFYGISGWIRIEWFALLFLMFYSQDVKVKFGRARSGGAKYRAENVGIN